MSIETAVTTSSRRSLSFDVSSMQDEPTSPKSPRKVKSPTPSHDKSHEKPKGRSRSRSLAEIRRARARQRWQRVNKLAQSAGAAFSEAGLERRKAFLERRWHTVAGCDPPGPQRLRVPVFALTEASSSTEVEPPSSPYRLSREHTAASKSVSFEDAGLPDTSGKR